MEPEKPAFPQKSLEAAPQPLPVKAFVPATHKKRSAPHSKKSVLYMYVEDYLGFRQEGFNFAMSPRFQMVIQDDKRILRRMTLTENESYWEDHPFFGKNISGLSVLIGANGSGKTTLIRLLLSWLRYLAANKQPDIPGVLVFRETKKQKKQVTHIDRYCSFLGKEENRTQATEETMQRMTVAEAASFLSDVSFTYYTDTLTDPELFGKGRWQDFDNLRLGASSQYIDYSLNARLSNIRLDPTWKRLPRAALRRVDFATQAKNLKVLLGTSQKAEDALIEYLCLTAYTDWEKFPIKEVLEEKARENYHTATSVLPSDNTDMNVAPQVTDYERFLSSSKEFHAILEKRLISMDNKDTIILTVLGGVLLSFVSTVLYTAKEQENDMIKALETGLGDLIDSLRKDEEVETGQQSGVNNWMKDLLAYIGDVSALSEDDESEVRKQAEHMKSLLEYLDWIKITAWKVQPSKEMEWVTRVPTINADDTFYDSFQAFLSQYNDIPSLSSYFAMSWSFPSSGQENYCNLLTLLNTLTGDGFNRWVFLDEPDNAFHPEWQRTLIQRILCCCGEHNPACFQLWVTTHSPIMLSDVPASASIRLTRVPGTEWKINESENKHNLSSFAQQIYTLFDDAFFMRNGVVGEFASEKIQALCKRLDTIEKKEIEADPSIQEKIKDISALIDQIQEPVLGGYLRMRLKLLHEVLSSKAKGEDII